jgi:hypothetical protein
MTFGVSEQGAAMSVGSARKADADPSDFGG